MATDATPTVLLTLSRGNTAGRTVPVTGTRFAIGREESCQLRPQSDLVSRRHAELEITPEGVTVRDLGSRNGTRVNDEPVTGPTPLHNGDRLEVGPLLFTVTIRGGAVATVPEAPERDPFDSALAPEVEAKTDDPGFEPEPSDPELTPAAAGGPDSSEGEPLAKLSDDDIADWLFGGDDEGAKGPRAGASGGKTRSVD